MQVLKRAANPEFKEVRLITDEGNNIVAIERAFIAAEAAGLDLVCVSTESSPPVCRIQDFNKIRFESKKSKKVKNAM